MLLRHPLQIDQSGIITDADGRYLVRLISTDPALSALIFDLLDGLCPHGQITEAGCLECCPPGYFAGEDSLPAGMPVEAPTIELANPPYPDPPGGTRQVS